MKCLRTGFSFSYNDLVYYCDVFLANGTIVFCHFGKECAKVNPKLVYDAVFTDDEGFKFSSNLESFFNKYNKFISSFEEFKNSPWIIVNEGKNSFIKCS
jgi:hypothetical protein